MIRTLGGIVAGMAAAIVILMLGDSIGYQLAGSSAPVAGGDLAAAPALSLPFLFFSAVGGLVAALAGGFASIVIAEQRWTSWAVAGAVIVANLINFALMAYPAWVMVAGVLLPALGGWAAQRLVSVREARRERRQISE